MGKRYRAGRAFRRARLLGPSGVALLLGVTLAVPSGATAIGSPRPLASVVTASGPPSVAFGFPPPGSVIAGVIDVALVASDTAGVVAPTHIYRAQANSSPNSPGHEISQIAPGHGPPADEVTHQISGPGEVVTTTQTFDTTTLPDNTYRLTGVVSNTAGQATSVTEEVTVDNTAPKTKITSPNQGRVVTVSDTLGVSGSVSDDHLASWSLVASIASTPIATLGSGTGPIANSTLGTYSGHMAPPGYVGPVDLVLTATDSAIPVANVSSVIRTITSDYYLNAYGALALAPSYEISTTIPIDAAIAGQVASWHFEAARAGESAALITRDGNTVGDAVHLADFDIASTYGSGDYVFALTVTDTTGNSATDTRAVTFTWRPAHLEITYIGPPLGGPGPSVPLTQFTDPTIDGIVEVRGAVTGSNTWAWALGRPIRVMEPSFASDKVVFSSNIDDVANFDIYQVALDGTDLVRLTTNPGYDHAPKYSPDGSRIVFSSTRDYPNDSGTDIYLMGGDGTNITRATTTGTAQYPAFGPNGTAIAYGGPGGIFQLDLTTNQTTQITTGDDRFANYSPDSTALVFERGPTGSQQIYVADLSSPGYPVSQLASVGSSSGQPAFSPDGTSIAFVSDYSLWVMSATGTNPVPFGLPGLDPTWVADGSRIAYSATVGASAHNVYLINWNPVNPADHPDPVGLVVNASANRVPDVSSPQLPFPPAPAKNTGGYVGIDIAPFAKSPTPIDYWGYLRTPPDQLPVGERMTDSILGYIDTSRLPAGVSALSLVAFQCDVPPGDFAYRLGLPPDSQTQATVAEIAKCNAYSTDAVPIRVGPITAKAELAIATSDSGVGIAATEAVNKRFSAFGSYRRPDGYVFSPSQDPASPLVARFSGRTWAKGYPASSDNTYVPAPDLAALQDIHGVIDDPALGLQVLGGLASPPIPVATGEQFAPGRFGARYEVDLPVSPAHLDGANHVTAWAENTTGLLGAITWTYSYQIPARYTPLPGAGGWGASQPVLRQNQVRLDVFAYNRDTELAVPNPGGNP